MRSFNAKSIGSLTISALFIAFSTTSSARASAAPFEDSLAQRARACIGCHGDQGRAAADGYYPRIAGKPAGYLYSQLKHFQRGQRNYPLMAKLVDPLSDAYLWEIARHFASLDPPYPAPPTSTVPQEVLLRGEQLALRGDRASKLPACASCHGAQLTGVQPATPGLLGLPRDYINAQLGAWQRGTRKAHRPDCMADIAQQMKPDDVAAVSAWLASRPLSRQTRAIASIETKPPLDCGSFVSPSSSESDGSGAIPRDRP